MNENREGLSPQLRRELLTELGYEDSVVLDPEYYDEAIEWIDYNTIRAIPYMGEKAPIVMYSLPE